MIDLTQIEDKTFDIKLNEEIILNIRKPSIQLFRDINKMVELIEKNEEQEKLMSALYLFLTRILNRNNNDHKFNQAQVEEMFSLDVAMYVMQQYQEWAVGVLEGINF